MRQPLSISMRMQERRTFNGDVRGVSSGDLFRRVEGRCRIVETFFVEKCLKCGKLYRGKRKPTPLICRKCGTHMTLKNSDIVIAKKTIFGLREVKEGK